MSARPRSSSPSSHGCPYEDAVVATFVDGGPAEDAGALAEHLDACVDCLTAVDESRRLDSLLASQTEARIDETRADALLAFVAPAPALVSAGEPTRATPAARAPRAAAVLAAAATLLGLALGWHAMQPRREAAPQPTAGNGALPPAGGTPSVPPALETGETGREPARADALRLPEGARPFRLAKLRAEHAATVGDPARLLRAFAGGFVAELPPERLEAAARAALALAGVETTGSLPLLPYATLDARRPARGAAQADFAAPFAREDARLRHAAFVWLRDQLRDGTLRDPAAAAAAIAQAVGAASGAERAAFVAALREQPGLLATLAAGLSDLARGRRIAMRPSWLETRHAGALAGILGAAGHSLHRRRLAELTWPIVVRATREAARTGDRTALAFIVDVYLAAGDRGLPFGAAVRSWIRGLDRPSRGIVTQLVIERIASSPRHDDRQRLEALLARAGPPLVALEHP